MEVMNKPSMSMFGKRGANVWAKVFVSTLVPGEPAPLPVGFQNEGGRVSVYNAAKARGFKVQTLTYNGKIWVARV